MIDISNQLEQEPDDVRSDFPGGRDQVGADELSELLLGHLPLQDPEIQTPQRVEVVVT